MLEENTRVCRVLVLFITSMNGTIAHPRTIIHAWLSVRNVRLRSRTITRTYYCHNTIITNSIGHKTTVMLISMASINWMSLNVFNLFSCCYCCFSLLRIIYLFIYFVKCLGSRLHRSAVFMLDRQFCLFSVENLLFSSVFLLFSFNQSQCAIICIISSSLRAFECSSRVCWTFSLG